MQHPSAESESLCFLYRAFAFTTGCGDWVKGHHVQEVIFKVLGQEAISASDFNVQLLPYPDNPQKIASTIVSFKSKIHFDGLLAQNPCTKLCISDGLRPLKFSAFKADKPLKRKPADEPQKPKHIPVDQPLTPSPSELKLYVHSLPSSANVASIKAHFGSKVDISGPRLARGRKHCWLTCSDRLEYDRVLALNNSIMEEHQIRVEAALPKFADDSVAAPAAALSVMLPSSDRSFDAFFDAIVKVSSFWHGTASQLWSDVPDVAQEVLANLGLAGYDKRPLPVQQYACPIIASGCCLLATAETGSGKTSAYLVPIISHILNQRATSSAPDHALADEVKRPFAVIIAPTHELVDQIAKAAKNLALNTCVSVSVVSGRLDPKQQRKELNRGCNLLVASMGRALQQLQSGNITLASTETLCFDEADVMLQGNGPREMWSMIQSCKQPVQVLMFSATFGLERRRIAREQMLPRDAVQLHVGHLGEITVNVDQNFFLDTTDSDAEKLKFLEIVLRRKPLSGTPGSTIIFVTTRGRVSFLVEHLVSISVSATGMHGHLVAEERQASMDLFSNRQAEVLVATGAFGRGLDLPFVTHVINFDLPNTRDEYAQQCGRAGRGGARGVATTIVPLTKARMCNPKFFSDMYALRFLRCVFCNIRRRHHMACSSM